MDDYLGKFILCTQYFFMKVQLEFWNIVFLLKWGHIRNENNTIFFYQIVTFSKFHWTLKRYKNIMKYMTMVEMFVSCLYKITEYQC